jgi:hypothetical protein
MILTTTVIWQAGLVKSLNGHTQHNNNQVPALKVVDHVSYGRHCMARGVSNILP